MLIEHSALKFSPNLNCRQSGNDVQSTFPDSEKSTP